MFFDMFRYLFIVTIFFMSATSVLSAEWVVRNAEIMGTTIHMEVWHEDKAIAQQAAESVLNAMHEVNQSMSPYIETSELYRVNREEASSVQPISEELYSLIEKSLQYSVKTMGAFDITFASVGYLYD